MEYFHFALGFFFPLSFKTGSLTDRRGWTLYKQDMSSGITCETFRDSRSCLTQVWEREKERQLKMSFQHGFSDIAQLLNTCNGFSGGKYDRKEAILSQVRYWLTVGSRLCTKLALGKRQPYKVGSPENETLTYLLNIIPDSYDCFHLWNKNDSFFFLSYNSIILTLLKLECTLSLFEKKTLSSCNGHRDTKKSNKGKTQ